MAVAYFGHTTESYTQTQTSEATSLPASTGANDLALALLGIFEDANAFNAAKDTSVSQSYTERVDGATGYNGTTNGEEIQLSIASKTLVGSDVAPTFSWTGNQDIKGGMYVARGTDITIEDVQVASGRGTTATSPAVTFTSSAGLHVVIILNWFATTTAFHASFTGRQTTQSYGMGDMAVSASGSTGTHAHTLGTTTAWVAISLALAEAAAGDPEGRLVGGKLVGGGLLVSGVLV